MGRAVRISSLLLMMIAGVWMHAQEVTPEPIVLESSALDAGAVLDELELAGLVPSGGQEVVVQRGLTYTGDGPAFSYFEIEDGAEHLVFGARLWLVAAADRLEYCGIASRVERVESTREEGDRTIARIELDAYAITAIDGEGNVFAVEVGDDVTPDLALVDAQRDLSAGVDLVAVVINDALTVFVDGAAVIEGYEITLPQGSLAFLYAGNDAASSCRAETLFAYTFSDAQVAPCTVSSSRAINQRTGPGTDFARVSQLLDGQSLLAVAQTRGTDGFIWWRLEDDTYVRDDVVNTAGFCRSLPSDSGE